MKKIIFTITMLAFTFSNAQSISFEVLSNASKRPKGKITEYVTSMGDTLKIGAKMKLGNPSNSNNSFVYILELAAMGEPAQASIKAQGWESEILKLRIGGSKRMGYSIQVVSKTEMGFTRYYTQYEKALSVMEIATDKLTRTGAIAKLKEAKDLLDLEIITQEEYSKIKAEMTPLIIN
jgi:hypothetical protein